MMNLGRSLSNLNSYVKNTVSKELKKKKIDNNSSFSVSLDQLKKILTVKNNIDLKNFLLETNLPELEINIKDEKVTIPNVEMFQSRVFKKLKLYYSFDDNDLLEINSKDISNERKREVIFKQKIILEKIYSASGQTKEDLEKKLLPSIEIDSGLISKEDDFENIVLNDLAILAKYSIRQQSLGNLLRSIIMNKDNLIILKSKKDKTEHVYISSVAISLGSCKDPFKIDEILEPELFDRTIYLFGSNGDELVICGIISHFIHDYAFFEGSVRYRLDPEELIKFFHLQDGGIESVSVEFISYDDLFKKGEKRSKEIINKFAKFEWMIKSYRNELEVSKKKLNSLYEQLPVKLPDLDIENVAINDLDLYIENIEIEHEKIPEEYISFKNARDIDISTVKNDFLLTLKEIKQTIKEKNFAESMIKYLT